MNSSLSTKIWIPTFFVLILLSITLGGGACEEAIEDQLDGEAAPLAQPDLPNCSRVITCCANLKSNALAPSSVGEQCSNTFEPAVSTILDSYGTTKQGITDGTNGDGETIDSFRTKSQETVEPGCRCFLEETVGKAGDFVLPADCEVVPETGSLESGQQCSEVTDTMFNSTLAGGDGGSGN